jgi:membrane fusion protein, heavy metal efflux system
MSDILPSKPMLPASVQAIMVLTALVVLCGGLALFSKFDGKHALTENVTDFSSQSRREANQFRPTHEQWANLTLKPVSVRLFTPSLLTEGKIAIDESRATPVFSPYTGRVIRLLAKPADVVEKGQPLFVIEATDMVKSQNDFLAALAALNKARAQLRLTQINEKRQHELSDAKAVPLKDYQQAQNDLVAAESDVRSTESALEAARNRLRILGRIDAEIAVIEEKHAISADSVIPAPVSGIVLQRKIGPGQYLSNASSDPAFLVGDLSTVWLVANVREADALKAGLGQAIEVRTLASPDRVFSGKIDYISSAIDASTRRILVRGTVDNSEGLLKPEMFAAVTLAVGRAERSSAVPRSAVVYEAGSAHIWIAAGQDSLLLRPIQIGKTDGEFVQVLSGVD